MQILLIRHGESEDDFLEENDNGSTDLPLTPNGLLQSEKMAQRVSKEFPPDFVWSSTLKRASGTADVLSKTIGCPVHYIDQLIEQQDSESNHEFRMRGESVLSYIRENSKAYSTIAVITHGGMITKIIESFLHLPFENNNWFHTNNTGIHFLDYYKDLQIIKFANSTRHLD
ncbi:histidine phosphatase family protein [Metabacillus sp. FJAT-52054]|uniref:Histidine phosphatase family protein n=1 Tax=Metabacillus sediminis TaxID=3117746 RepID=A0ABZ2NII9_9BACI